MFQAGGAPVVAATFVVAVSGSAMLAAANPVGVRVAQDSDASQESTREDCLRNGGWYVEDVGVCEYESSANAADTESDKQACEQNGGSWDAAASVCEIESNTEVR